MAALVQQTNEWKELRKHKIGASDAPVIMDVSPWKTPYKLWEEKVGLRNDNYVSTAMQKGLDLESTARDLFMDMTQLLVFPKVTFHRRYDWMMCSLDGIDIDEKNIVEIKVAGKEDHEIAKRKRIPDKYYPQLQHQLEVTGLEMAYYFSYRDGDGVIVEVPRDGVYIDTLVEEEKKFYDCMTNFVAPKMKHSDYISISDQEWEQAAAEWMKIQRRISDLKNHEEALKTRMIEMCESKDIKNAKGGGVRLCKSIRKGTIDYSAIPSLKNENLELYRKEPSQYWRLMKGD